jgi:hypothetical protein
MDSGLAWGPVSGRDLELRVRALCYSPAYIPADRVRITLFCRTCEQKQAAPSPSYPLLSTCILCAVGAGGTVLPFLAPSIESDARERMLADVFRVRVT